MGSPDGVWLGELVGFSVGEREGGGLDGANVGLLVGLLLGKAEGRWVCSSCVGMSVYSERASILGASAVGL